MNFTIQQCVERLYLAKKKAIDLSWKLDDVRRQHTAAEIVYAKAADDVRAAEEALRDAMIDTANAEAGRQTGVY